MRKVILPACLLLAILPVLWNCATTIPPTGGPKDTIPPRLINSIPENNQTSYKEQDVNLEFDEMVVLKNAKEEISITPSPGKDVEFIAKKRLVTVKFKKALDADKTYSISFRQSIQDITEGNPAEDARIAFSTGPVIDSLKLFGTVHVLPDDLPGEKYTVAIYEEDTFNIYKHTPSYFTRTDKKGRFTLYNLKPGRYHLYCFEDKNKNLKCDSQSERFGIYTDNVNLPLTQDSIRLNAVKLDSRPFKLNNYRNISNYGLIRLNKAPLEYTLTELSPEKKIPSQIIQGKPEITYYPPIKAPDSTKVRLRATDSLFQTIDTTFYIKQTSQKPVKEKFRTTLTEASYTVPTQELTASVALSLPLLNKPPDSIDLYLDTLFYRTIYFSKATYDTTYGVINYQSEIALNDSLQKKNLNIAFRSGSFISILQDSSSLIEKKLNIRAIANLATLIVTNSEGAKGILELLTDKGEHVTSQKVAKKNTFKNLDPNSVQLRLVDDTDKNNKWTWPNPLQNKPPEKIIYYINTSGKRQIPLRANWEVEIDWTKPNIVDKPLNKATKPKE